MSSAIKKHDKPIISTPIYILNNGYQLLTVNEGGPYNGLSD